MLKSERWTSKYLNKNKLDLLKQVDQEVLLLKNEISKFIFEHLKDLYYNQNVYSFSKLYLKNFKSKYLKVWNVQQIFQDITKLYLNLLKVYTQNIGIKVTKNKITYYKRNLEFHFKGSVKEFRVYKYSTNLTKLIKYLTYCNLNNFSLKPEIQTLYNYYCQKFTQKRIHKLVINIQNNILKNINKQINFTTGSFRVTYTTNNINRCSEFIKDNTNIKYKYWFKVDLNKKNLYLPLQINAYYNNFDKIRNAQFFVNVSNKKVNIISTKECSKPEFKKYNDCLGLDLNIKNNFCTLSNNKVFDYDRQYINKFIKELHKLNKIGLQNINKSQQKHLTKLIKSNEWYFKYLIHDILNYCEENNITDLVMEDLDKFNSSKIENKEFKVKYSRLCRLLRLTNIKNWLKSQAEKRGIKVHLTPANYSSQQCSHCGYIDKENRKSQEEFKCISCGYTNNADLNAAINLRNRLMNVSLMNSKLHIKDDYERLITNTKNKFIIKDILINQFNT